MPEPADPLCFMCRMRPTDVCQRCGRQFCESHGDVSLGLCDDCDAERMHSSGYRAAQAERAAERAQEADEKTQIDTEEMLRLYREQKAGRGESEGMVFRLNSSIDDIKKTVEKKRDKGGGLIKKRPEEKLAYMRLLQLPCIFFEYQYVKKKSLFGSKVPHKTSSVFSVKEWPPTFRPKLTEDVKGNTLVELKEGYVIPMDLEYAEERVAYYLASMKNAINPEAIKKCKKDLNLDADPENIQALQSVRIVYLPMWIAKLETPDTTRYLAYDYNGKEHKAMAEKINTDRSFASMLEKAQKI